MIRLLMYGSLALYGIEQTHANNYRLMLMVEWR